MADKDKQDDRLLTRPSPLPNEREYEKAAAEAKPPFRRSKAPADDSSGEAELRKGYNEARLDAKTQVVQMTPQLLEDYKNRLGGEINARRYYGRFVCILVIAWLVIVAGFILAAGLQLLFLNSTVLVALTTGATVSIIGLLGTVITYFFTKSNEQISLYKELFKAMIAEEKDK